MPADGGRTAEVAFGDSAAVLGCFASAPLASAVWRRTDVAVLAALDGWAHPFPQSLARDLRQLLALHALLRPGVDRRLRIERLVDDGCRRLHADHVASRLICTYAGAGTECLPGSAIGPAQFHRSPPCDPEGPRLLVAIDG